VLSCLLFLNDEQAVNYIEYSLLNYYYSFFFKKRKNKNYIENIPKKGKKGKKAKKAKRQKKTKI
jgi:hypothetical protein